jgi:hypothetical protein
MVKNAAESPLMDERRFLLSEASMMAASIRALVVESAGSTILATVPMIALEPSGVTPEGG